MVDDSVDGLTSLEIALFEVETGTEPFPEETAWVFLDIDFHQAMRLGIGVRAGCNP
jgi:hypothetical protein